MLILSSLLLLSCEKEMGQESDKVASSKMEYYQDANGKTRDELKTALNKIVTENHYKLTYQKAYNDLEVTDEDPDNSDNIILFYTERSHSKKVRSQFDSKDGWNRERMA